MLHKHLTKGFSYPCHVVAVSFGELGLDLWVLCISFINQVTIFCPKVSPVSACGPWYSSQSWNHCGCICVDLCPHFGRLWLATWGLFLSPELCQEELVHHTFLFSLALFSWWQAPRVHSSWTFLPGSRFVEPIPRVLCVRCWPPFSHALLYIKGLSPSHWFYWSSVLSSCVTVVICMVK